MRNCICATTLTKRGGNWTVEGGKWKRHLMWKGGSGTGPKSKWSTGISLALPHGCMTLTDHLLLHALHPAPCKQGGQILNKSLFVCLFRLVFKYIGICPLFCSSHILTYVGLMLLKTRFLTQIFLSMRSTVVDSTQLASLDCIREYSTVLDKRLLR